jgi:hypothetical protein
MGWVGDAKQGGWNIVCPIRAKRFHPEESVKQEERARK